MSLEERDRNMMKNPSNWPRWPLLPIKNCRDTEPGEFPRLGVLVEAHSGDLRFVEGNIYQVTPEAIMAASPADVDELLDDGWVVD